MKDERGTQIYTKTKVNVGKNKCAKDGYHYSQLKKCAQINVGVTHPGARVHAKSVRVFSLMAGSTDRFGTRLAISVILSYTSGSVMMAVSMAAKQRKTRRQRPPV